jgi:hypothetical protein
MRRHFGKFMSTYRLFFEPSGTVYPCKALLFPGICSALWGNRPFYYSLSSKHIPEETSVSMDSNGREPDKSPGDAEGVMFPSTPIWERGKRRGAGGRRSEPAAGEPVTHEPVAAEQRSFAAEDPDDHPLDLDRPIGAAPMTSEPEAAGMVAPIGRTAQTPKSRGLGAGAAVAGIAAAALLAAGGWYVMRDTDTVPELAPGSAASEVATAPPAATLPPTELPPAAATPTPSETARAEAKPAAPARTERRVAAATPRARPASSTAAAESSGVDASATLPDSPQPYTSLNPGATPAPVNPTQAAPTPAPPEPIPSTPPTAPQASPPSTTQDPTPQSATPPQ